VQYGGNLLHWACLSLSFNTVAMLVRKGIDLNVVCYEKKCTPLHDAVKAYCEANTEEELRDGANIIALLMEKGCKYQLRNSVRLTSSCHARNVLTIACLLLGPQDSS
jgi:ankyrin repeat protein